MIWSLKRIISAAAVMQLGWLCTAEELSDEEIKKIDRIVNTATAIEETNGNDAQSAILKSIDEAFPVILHHTPESTALIRSLEEQANRKYSATDQELEIEYQAAAEDLYPIYKTGQTVTVVYQLYRKPFTVSGPFYRQDDKFVWVGSQKIPKSKLHRKFVSCFNPDLAMTLRKNHVAAELQRYHRTRESYLEMLKTRNQEKILKLTGGLESALKRSAARKTAMKKYLEAVVRRKEIFNSAFRMYAKDKAEACRIMEKAIEDYPGTPEAEKGRKILPGWKMEMGREKATERRLQAIQKAEEEHRQNVFRRTGRYPCSACGGRGSHGGSWNPNTGFHSSTCNACGGTGLE